MIHEADNTELDKYSNENGSEPEIFTARAINDGLQLWEEN